MVIGQSENITEIARERETFKYDALTLSTAGLHGAHPPKLIPSAFLSTAPDPGLTAFAQLGQYRLNAARVMISLFDRRFQHIVAEALRPLPLSPDPVTPDSETQRPWFNGLTFERATSVCEHVVTGAAACQSIPGTTSGLTSDDIPVSVINHLDGDKRYCHIQDPGRQFYAGVPIRSPTGINIGVYCVFDDKPRPQGLSTDEVRFIRDISRVVMDYLESKRSHEWYRRDQRMVRGLGSFVKGQSTLWTWPEGDSAHPASFQDLPGMREGLLRKELQPQQQHRAPDGKEKPVANDTPLTPGGRSGGDANDIAKTTTQASFAPKQAATTSPSRPQLIPTKSQSGPTDTLRKSVERVFSKAANVIRESIEVEGVLFMDARVRSYGGLVGNAPSEPPLSLAEARKSASKLSSGDESSGSASRHLPAAGHSVCDVLGFSTSASCSIVHDPVPTEFTKCREWFLQRLLRKHKLGMVWNFEADGSVADPSTSSDSDEPPSESRRTPATFSPHGAVNRNSGTGPGNPKKRLNTAARIIKMFPGARSVAVVPLLDTQTGRWYAAGFAWTRTPTRTFNEENELTFLRVFGLTAMAEVARLKTRAADKAKTDTLGSISHELRSPLHGLVGAVDLLRHTTLDVLQGSILRTIEASGRTLLDTIDHLLDFVKINAQLSKHGRTSRSMDIHHRASLSVPEMVPLSDVPIQLDLLVEEVVESVLAGSSYLTRADSHLPSSFISTKSPVTVKSSPSATDDQAHGQLVGSGAAVQFYLDIDHAARWSFGMHPGAFRRIIMNLFGNSLKFTRSGFIRVSLRQESQPERPAAPGSTVVVLSVSDSGKGMSEDFLRNHLFTPFSQEDQFASGTGLGLSLVRHMTETLGGSIDVSSKVGEGTTVTVALPLPRVAGDGATEGEDEIMFWQSVKTLNGKRVKLCGFERETRARDIFGTADTEQESQYQLMEGTCRDMLQMDVVSVLNIEPAVPDFVVCVAGDGPINSDPEMTKQMARCPHIFVYHDLASAHRLTEGEHGESPLVYEICSQPIGPRKLARALLACQLRWQAAHSTDTDPGLGFKASIEQTHVQHDNETPSYELKAKDLPLILAQERRKYIAPEPSSCMPVITRSPTPSPPKPVLPQHREVISSQVNGSGPQSAAKEQRRKILIVDDNAINLKIMAAYLAKLQHPFATAINGLEALELYTRAPADYSCLLTDVSMPVMDGLESTRRIRAFELKQGHDPVVVIALTGLSGAEVRQDACASGVDLFLTRPLPLRGLEEALVTTGLR